MNLEPMFAYLAKNVDRHVHSCSDIYKIYDANSPQILLAVSMNRCTNRMYQNYRIKEI